MKAKWFCKDCYNSAGVEVEILTVANVFDEKCIICDARADYLVAEPKRLLTQHVAGGYQPHEKGDRMKIVINDCYGGFGISYKATMRLAELRGIKLYPFIEERDQNGNTKIRPYKEGEKAFTIRYSTEPLKSDGTYEPGSYWTDHSIDRADPSLIQIVEEMGKNANGKFAKLKIIEIPDSVMFEIDEYDGMESIHEVHKSWS